MQFKSRQTVLGNPSRFNRTPKCSKLPGNQVFTFVGRVGFSETAGELQFKAGILSGDVDGDGTADFDIAFTATANLGAADIIL